MRARTIAVALALLAACSSPVDLIGPEVAIEQISAPNGGTRYYAGRMAVTYRLFIANRSEEPLVLKRVSLTNYGGPYRFPPYLQLFNVTIGPGEFETVEFTVNAISRSTQLDEPTTLRGFAYFDSPAGALREFFHAEARYDPRRSRSR